MPAVAGGAPRRRRRPRTGRLALAALIGAAAGLGQAPVSLPWITLLALGLALRQHLAHRGAVPAAWIGWATGAGYFAATLFWIVEPFFVDPARHGWMAPFALVGMAGGMALFWALGAALAVLVARGGGRLRRALVWALALTGAEALRSYIMTGFPWALVGHVWIGWAPMQLAASVGPIGLSLLTVLIVALVVALWRKRPLGAALAVLPFALLYGVGAWQAAQPVPSRPGDAPVLRLIQPNAAQHLKWQRDMAQVFFDRQVAMTAAAPGSGANRPDLTIWPETAVPTLLNNAEVALEIIADAAAGRAVALGIQRLEGARAFNSLVVMDGSGAVSEIYDKHHLVPFGEYLPLGGLLSRVGLSAFTSQEGFGYAPGPGARVLDLGPLGLALPLICYEAIFPQDLRAAPRRAEWILQITNDGWFGQIAGPYQHLAQARLRAVEQGLPMVRVANTGVSAVIDARGRIEASLGLGVEGYLDAVLPGALPTTIYARTGDFPVVALILAGLLGSFGQGLARRLRLKSD